MRDHKTADNSAFKSKAAGERRWRLRQEAKRRQQQELSDSTVGPIKKPLEKYMPGERNKCKPG
jgi:hypothetical protein